MRESSRYKNIKRILNNPSVWAILAVVIRSLVNFFTAPYVTRTVGIEAYGFVTLGNNIVTYIDIIAISFNYFSERYISIAYHQKKVLDSHKYYSSIFITDLIICAVLLLPIGIFICKVEIFLYVSPHLLRDVQILFFCIFLKYCFTLVGTTFNVGAFIKNRVDITSKNRVISYLVQVIVLFCLFSCFIPKVWYVGIASLSASVIFFLLQYKTKTSLLRDFKFKWSDYTYRCIKELFLQGFWVSLNNIGNILNHGLDLLITNLMVSETMVGMISVAKLLGTFGYTIVITISGSLQPTQLKQYSLEKHDELADSLKQAMRITGGGFTLFLFGFIGWGEDFLSLWLPGQDIGTLYKLTVICILSDFIPSCVNPLYYTYTLTKRMKVPCYITLFMGAVNIISMYLLLKTSSMGGYAVVATTMVINWVHLLDAPLYAAYCLHRNWKTFYSVILMHIFSGGIQALIALLLRSLFSYASDWLSLIIKAFLFAAMGLGICMVTNTTKNERHVLMSKLGRGGNKSY